MIVQTDSTDFISPNSTGTGTVSGACAHGNHARTIRSDAECRARAGEFLTELIGSPRTTCCGTRPITCRATATCRATSWS